MSALASAGGEAGAVAALARSALFAAFSPALRQRLFDGGELVQLAAGDILARAGEPGEAIYLILEGEAEVRAVAPNGDELRLAALPAGAVIGEMAVLDGGPRSADLYAARRTKALRIARAAILAALEEEPKACIALAGELSRRLRATNAQIEDLRVLDLGARLAQLLLTEAGGRDLATLSQTEMARRLGAARESVNRKLHAWAERGWIAIGRFGVRLLRPDSLSCEITSQRHG